MNFKMMIQNGTESFDVTSIIEGEVVLENSVAGSASRLFFRLIRDGIAQFTEGSKITFSVDDTIKFSGWIMKKSRTSEQILSVTAYDQIFYLSKNKSTYMYQNKKASELIHRIANDYGLETGNVVDTKWNIPFRVEEGKTLLDMIFSALEITERNTGEKYIFFDQGGELALLHKKDLVLPIFLSSSGQIQDYSYTTDISEKTYNTVCLFQADRKEIQKLAFSTQCDNKIKSWGKLQYYEKVDHQLNQPQLKEMAESILNQQCCVQRSLHVVVLNPDLPIQAGNSILLEIPELGDISLKKMCFIEKTTNYYSDGENRVELQIAL